MKLENKNAKSMRSGFSMIELIFVIVILGVLAAVAIPKFATNKGEAELASVRNSVATIVKSSGGFILKNGKVDFRTLGLGSDWDVSEKSVTYNGSSVKCNIETNTTNGLIVDINCTDTATCSETQYDANYTF